jgi:hypothetical protein
VALAAAAEMPHVGLVEALELCLLLCAAEPQRYERAALRWHGRFCAEVRGIELDEAQVILAALAALRGSRRSEAAHALAELVHGQGLERASEALIRWSAARG